MSLTVYRASAGSGKTFTLVKEFLRFALNDKSVPMSRFKQTLAITFTNKAAGEMKERVITALSDIANNPDSKYGEIPGLDKEELQKRAPLLLKSILHHYSDLSIGTIDSFVHRVIRTFANELKISQNFEIEMDSDAMLDEAIETLLSKTGSNELLTNALIEFTESKADDEKSWQIENDLKQFAKQLLKEDNQQHLLNIKELDHLQLQEIKNALRKHILEFETFLSQKSSTAIQLIKSNHITSDKFHYKDAGVYGYLNKLSAKRFDGIYSNSRANEAVTKDKWLGKEADASDKDALEHILPELKQLTSDILNKVNEQGGDYIVWQLIYRNIFSLIILNEIEKEIDAYKVRYNALPIAEFNTLISKVVASEPVPFIYERIGERYKNYMIDEFQDTSILHWQNLLPLIENTLSQGHHTLLVGDGKQAIYRWRGGDVEQFAKLPEPHGEPGEMALERMQSLKNFYQSKVLGTNYRSKAEVVIFNNVLFNILSTKLAAHHQTIYHQQEQQYNPKNTGGYIKIDFRDKDEVEDFWNNSLTEKYINDCIADGYRYKDICVIVRKNKHGIEIVNHLNQCNIPVISSESLLLQHSDEVNFIVNVLTLASDHHNDISSAAIIEYLSRKKQINVSSRDFSEQKMSFESILKTLNENNLHIHFERLNTQTIYEACENIIRIFKLEPADPYLIYFLEEVLEYTTKKTNKFNNFFEWWEKRRRNASLSMPDDLDAVKVMSIHKSKGLEFPVVIVPYASWDLKGRDTQIWVEYDDEKIPELRSVLLPAGDKLEKTKYEPHYRAERDRELLDNINLLYVACTRPEERLYLLSGEAKADKNEFKNISDLLTIYVKEKQQGNVNEVYELGKPSKHISKANSTNEDRYRISHSGTYDWSKRVTIKKRTRHFSADAQQKLTYGNLIHDILSQLKSIDDLEQILNVRHLQGEITDEERIVLNEKLTKILSNPQVRAFFDPLLEVKAERDIILPNGEMYRPDRVIIQQNKAIIIDYKTGEESSEHQQQISHYASLLNQMGYTSTELYLIYTDSEKVLKV